MSCGLALNRSNRLICFMPRLYHGWHRSVHLTPAKNILEIFKIRGGVGRGRSRYYISEIFRICFLPLPENPSPPKMYILGRDGWGTRVPPTQPPCPGKTGRGGEGWGGVGGVEHHMGWSDSFTTCFGPVPTTSRTPDPMSVATTAPMVSFFPVTFFLITVLDAGPFDPKNASIESTTA